MGFTEARQALLDNGMQHVVQVRFGEVTDQMGNKIEQWADTKWASIGEAEEIHPELQFRNIVTANSDQPIKLLVETEPEELVEYDAYQGSHHPEFVVEPEPYKASIKRYTQLVKDDMQAAGIPVETSSVEGDTTEPASRFGAVRHEADDCGCGLGKACKFYS